MAKSRCAHLAVAGGLLAASCSMQPMSGGNGNPGGMPAPMAATAFILSSPDFIDDQLLDRKYATNARDCGGNNVSPALNWVHPPTGTKSYAIVMYDPDGQKGLGVVHWLAYNITATALPEGGASAPSNLFTGGTNLPGTQLYYGPCPPVGDAPHHYVIHVIATDLPGGTLPGGLRIDALYAALKGHTLGSASLIGRYGR